jgi:hypothetical protein
MTGGLSQNGFAAALLIVKVYKRKQKKSDHYVEKYDTNHYNDSRIVRNPMQYGIMLCYMEEISCTKNRP